MSELLAALCLVLVVEGLMPFLAPARWRETMQRIIQMSDGQLRTIGLACIVAGLVGYWVMQLWP